jgi:hypothetical protein
VRFLVPLGLALGLTLAQAQTATTIGWTDVAPLRSRFEARGLSASSFPRFVASTHADNLRRVREGDLDHLIFYALQSTHFTDRPPIEPALSAKAFVSAGHRIPPDARARIGDLLRTLESRSTDARLAYFRDLVHATFPSPPAREPGLEREYSRAMRFLYEKEFGAGRGGGAAIADLYRTRGLSTDTAVEAGFVVYNGLGILKSLEPTRRIRRVLIVGPGLDLAPRTALLESGPPESYQPWAVIDALLSLGLSRADDLQVIGADINPRVVEHLRRARRAPPSLRLVTGLRETDTVTLSADYKEYFARLGRAIGEIDPAGLPSNSVPGHMAKFVRVAPPIAATLDAAPLDIVTERLEAAPFDLIIATNILPYFDDVELMLAMTNISRMLGPGGVFLHNEPRPALGEITDALGLPYEQSRQVVIATVRGAAAPLVDSVWLHRRHAK